MAQRPAPASLAGGARVTDKTVKKDDKKKGKKGKKDKKK
jgi:hypothetical protein